MTSAGGGGQVAGHGPAGVELRQGERAESGGQHAEQGGPGSEVDRYSGDAEAARRGDPLRIRPARNLRAAGPRAHGRSRGRAGHGHCGLLVALASVSPATSDYYPLPETVPSSGVSG